MHDAPAIGEDPKRNNDFLYKAEDAIGYKTPPGSHPPHESAMPEVSGLVRIHRMIRRGTAYGPLLPEGVLEDDGVDRRINVRLRRRSAQAANSNSSSRNG